MRSARAPDRLGAYRQVGIAMQRTTRAGRWAILGLTGPSLLFLTLWFYLPLAHMLAGALGNVGDILRDPFFWRLLTRSTQQAAYSAGASALLGLPMAVLLANYRFPFRRTLRSLMLVPFVLPAVVVSLGFILFFGNSGILNRLLEGWLGWKLQILYQMPAIVLAHAFYNAPVVARSVHAAWERIDPTYEESARALGAGSTAVFRDITLPMLVPGLATGTLLAFLFSFMSFPIVLTLGGARFSTLEVEIYTQIRILMETNTGSALALLQTLFSLTLSYAYLVLEGRFLAPIRSVRERPLRSLGWSWKAWAFLAYGLCVAVLYLGPILSIAYDSLVVETEHGIRMGLVHYRQVFAPDHEAIVGDVPLAAIRNSLLFGMGTVCLALPMGAMMAAGLARRFKGARLVEVLGLAPLAVSSVAFGFSVLRAFRLGPFAALGPEAAIIFAHAILAFPFVLRSLRPIFERLDPSLRDAARSLGAPPFKAFLDVELPLAAAGLLLGAVLAFAISLSEMSATIMLVRPGMTTMPLSLYQMLSARAFGASSAMAVVLMAITGLAFVVVERCAESALAGASGEQGRRDMPDRKGWAKRQSAKGRLTG